MAGLVNGTDLIIKVGTDNTDEIAVAFATTCSLEMSMDEIDQTNKDSGGWKQIIGGLRSWSISSEALYQNEAITGASAKNTYTNFWNHIADSTSGTPLQRTKVYVEFMLASGTTGNYYYSGDAFVTSLTVNGGTEDQATYSVSLTGTGVLSQTAV